MFTLMSKQSTLLQVTSSFGGMNSVPVNHIFEGPEFVDLCAKDAVMLRFLSKTLCIVVGDGAWFAGDIVLEPFVGYDESMREKALNKICSTKIATLERISDKIVLHLDDHVIDWEAVNKEIKDLKPLSNQA